VTKIDVFKRNTISIERDKEKEEQREKVRRKWRYMERRMLRPNVVEYSSRAQFADNANISYAVLRTMIFDE
jgi:hypothetical protein